MENLSQNYRLAFLPKSTFLRDGQDKATALRWTRKHAWKVLVGDFWRRRVSAIEQSRLRLRFGGKSSRAGHLNGGI